MRPFAVIDSEMEQGLLSDDSGGGQDSSSHCVSDKGVLSESRETKKEYTT